MLPVNSSEAIDMAKEKLEYLIVDSENIEKIPNGFRPIIPIGTKILNLDLKDKLFTINFSKEF